MIRVGFWLLKLQTRNIKTHRKENNINNRKLKARENLSPITDHYNRNGEIEDILNLVSHV